MLWKLCFVCLSSFYYIFIVIRLEFELISIIYCWIGKFPMDDILMCGSQKHFRVSGRTKRLFSLCMDSMARHETNTCDIWKTVRMISENEWNPNNAYLIYFSFTAYLSRDFNVVLVDWKKLTYYPCYFSALGNTKLVAQCTAQVKMLAVIRDEFHWSPTISLTIVRERNEKSNQN